MAENKSVAETGAAPTGNSDEVVVSIRDLHKTYDGETVILKGIDLDVHRGEVVVVLGPSGSGKSTMLRCVNLLETPTSGQIVFEGTDITQKGVDINAVRRQLGMVFQQFNLFPHLSVKKNVMLAQEKVLKRSPEEAERVAVEELTKVGLAERIDYMPSQLSGGQQQRVAIARAIVIKPKLLLADEPTGSLDSARSIEIMKLLTDLNQTDGITVSLVTHEPDMAKFARRHIIFKDGHLVRDDRGLPGAGTQTLAREDGGEA